MTTRILSPEQAANLARVSAQRLSDMWQTYCDDGFREAVESYPEDELLAMPIYRHPGENEPREILLNLIERSIDSLSECESDLLKMACLAHDNMLDILSMRSLEKGFQGLFDVEDIFRLPRFALSLREPLDVWLERSAPDNKVMNAPWFNKIHPSGKDKTNPSNGDQMLYLVAESLSKDDFNAIFDKNSIARIIKFLTDARKDLSDQVHYKPSTLILDHELVLSRAIGMLSSVLSVRNIRGTSSVILGAYYSEHHIKELSDCIRRYMEVRCKTHALELTGDAFISSIEAATFKGGVGIEVIGSVKCEHATGASHDIRFNINAGFDYKDISKEVGDEFVTHSHRQYFNSIDRPSNTIEESLKKYFASPRSKMPVDSYSKISQPIEDHIKIKFRNEEDDEAFSHDENDFGASNSSVPKVS